MRPILLAAALLVGLATPAQAQFTAAADDEVIAQGIQYRVFARPGEATIRVQVLGDIGSGIYVLSPRVTLTELLALGGGTLAPTTPEVRRTVTVRLLREEGGSRRAVYESELREMLREPGAHPPLRDGDLVTVETVTARRYTLIETVQLVAGLASITLLLLQLVD